MRRQATADQSRNFLNAAHGIAASVAHKNVRAREAALSVRTGVRIAGSWTAGAGIADAQIRSVLRAGCEMVLVIALVLLRVSFRDLYYARQTPCDPYFSSSFPLNSWHQVLYVACGSCISTIVRYFVLLYNILKFLVVKFNSLIRVAVCRMTITNSAAGCIM